MVVQDIDVKTRLITNPESKAKAIADVKLLLGDGQGSITMGGFIVIVANGKPPWVRMPARKGNVAWFDTVTMEGAIDKVVETAVLQEYGRQIQQPRQ
jgi:hypothetical protein